MLKFSTILRGWGNLIIGEFGDLMMVCGGVEI